MDNRESRERGSPGEMPPDAEAIRRSWQDSLQDYVDGTLDEKKALRLHLDAQRIEALQRDLDEMRELFSALDRTPRAEPGADFDQAVLEGLPYEFYASAPRRPQRVLIFADADASAVTRGLGYGQRLSIILLLLDLGVLAFGRTIVARPFVAVAAWLGGGVEALVDSTASWGFLHSVALATASGYSALQSFVSSTATGQASIWIPLTLVSIVVTTTLLARVRLHREQAEVGASR